MHELDDAALELRLRQVLVERLASLPLDITLEDLERRREIGAVARRRRRRLVALALAAALLVPFGVLAGGGRPLLEAFVAPMPSSTSEASAMPEASLPAASPAPSAGLPSATPAATPVAPESPSPAGRLAVETYDAGGCGGRLIEIDVATGKLSEPLEGCFDVVGVRGGGRFVVAGGGTRVPTGDGYSIIGDQGGATVMNLVTGDAAHVTNLQPTAQLAPGGQWALEYGPNGHARVGPIDGSRWVEMPTPAGTGTPSGPAPSSWSPDGAHLAVRTDRGLAVWDGGSSAFHLVDSILGSVWSWSADGQTVASIWGERVYVADIAGTTVVDVTDFPGGGVGGVWLTPDGKTVVEWKDRSLRVIGPDGDRHTIPLEKDEMVDSTSPDGRMLALTVSPVTDKGSTGHTRVVTMAGQVVAQVDASHVAWAQDSRGVAVWVTPSDLDPQSTTAKIPKAKGTTYIVLFDGTTTRVPDATSPAWSPDGLSIAFLSGPGDQSIEVVAADGSGRRAVTAKPIKAVNGLTWIP